MKLKAEIGDNAGKTKHSFGYIDADEPIEEGKLPSAKWLEIVEGDSGFYLYHYTANGECISDTWHSSVNEAMAQAEFEFQIKEIDWYEIE